MISIYDLMVVAAAVALVIKLIAKCTCGKYTLPQDLSGTVVVITGGNRGIGLETWRALAMRGAECHIFARDWVEMQRAAWHAGEMKRAGHDHIKTEFYRADMSSFESIREGVGKFLAAHDGPVDILINNAGLGWLPKRTLTADGLELTLGVNHFAPFLMTHLLLDRLRQSRNARIVNLSSIASYLASSKAMRTFLENPTYEGNYDHFTPYNVSKQCNLLFTREAQRRLGKENINSYAVHPGSVKTDLFRYMSIIERVLVFVLHLFAKTPVEGAQTSLYCALDAKAVPGEYHADCMPFWSPSACHDMDAAHKLWTLSERLCDIPVEKRVPDV